MSSQEQDINQPQHFANDWEAAVLFSVYTRPPSFHPRLGQVALYHNRAVESLHKYLKSNKTLSTASTRIQM